MAFSEQRLLELATEAAERVLDAGSFDRIEITVGADSDGDPAYFINYEIVQASDRQSAARQRSSLSRYVRDKLLEAGDETYPYIRVIPRLPAGSEVG